MTKKLAIISTHPIQYYAPIFRLLDNKMDIQVFYTRGDVPQYDHGFKKNISWDIPLTDGYTYEFLENTAKDKGSHHFKGIINPNAITKINDFKPDAILIYGWAYQSHLKIMRHFKGKILIYFRGDSTLIDQQPGFKNILRSIFLKWVYQHIDTAFYVGTANYAYFKKYGLKEKQLVFAPHAIDNTRFSTDRKDEADQLREKLNIDKEDILILFAGKLEPKKDPELLLDAFIKLNSTNIHLLFVGNGVLEEQLKAKVKNDHLENVLFMDFQNQTQMPVVYQACDLFCLPSKGPGETWGLAVNEAMAAGKAVLVSDKVGCASDLVTNHTGAIFKSRDLADLSQKLIALTKDKTILKINGQNAFITIQNWSFEQQINAISKYVNS
ncbi:glycosyltransferase family 4 protein [Pedobacter sp. Hv1]|uniref:glycosyltransferase family 4 protein n=1 Tax=Pedobacter sp. Hv1 TaxID=1740090 RepID=UPI0006D8D49A|nr:glycosyltransferase family 4 protein [Pedobacter sp. Hv1]KQC02435.1 glycosyl transferase family 1 [Pedobacter sp. Hv1]